VCFRRERGRRCDEPTYLSAKVRRGRWKIRFRTRLPRGRYVMITRAVARSGAIERTVSRKLGNLKRFRVR
jgi:hypothetical protein